LNFDWFRPQDIIILLAIGLIGGVIVAGHLSVRSNKKKIPAVRNNEDGE